MNKPAKREKQPPAIKDKQIMLNKYGLSVGAAYTEQCTLLEPNNFIPSWEAGDEEKKEVSNALRNLREKYDGIRRLRNEKERALDQLNKDVAKAQQELNTVSKDTGGGQADKEQTENHLAMLQESYLFQSLTKRIRNHMLDRQKKDLIALTLKINGLQESLRSKTNIHNEASAVQMKTRQEKLQSQYKLHSLMQMIDHEQKKRQERITSLQLSIQNKQDALQKRLTRAKRQAEIAELAANSSSDKTEDSKRQSLFVNRAWSAFFKKRMAREMAKYRPIEESFQQIRVQTNNSDVREIVQKFMTKEQTYASLLLAVTQNERKYDELKAKNQEKQRIVRDLQIANENRRQIVAKPDPGDETACEAYELQMRQMKAISDDMEANESNYANLQLEQDQLQAELVSQDERKKNMQLINDQVGGWTARVAMKMQEQLGGMTIQTENRSLVDVLREIQQLSRSQLGQIKQQKEQQQDDDEDSVGDKDYMGDFVSEEYVTKNIRVMPMVGGPSTMDNQSEHTSKFITAASNMGGAGVDSDHEESKHNQEAYIQMMDQRAEAKERRAEAERKAQEAAEREAKLKQRNK